MRKLFFLFTVLFAFLSAACSDGGPTVTSFSQSTYYPVTEQKVVLQVSSLSDNPPMTFTWNYDSTNSSMQDSLGNLIASGAVTNMFGVYWTTPQTPGFYTVSCIIGDKLSKTDTVTFLVYVSARPITMLMDANPASAVVISSDLNTTNGGLFAVVLNDKDYNNIPNNNMKMFATNMFKYDMTWGANYSLTALYPIYYSSLYQSYYTYWGGYLSDNTINIIRHSSSSDDVKYSQQTSANDSVNSITVINNNIWVSANSGLWKVDPSSTGFINPPLAVQSYNADGSSGLSAVATSLGVYYCTTNDMNWQPLPGGQGKAISVVTLANPLNIFALMLNGTQRKLMQYYKENDIWANKEIEPDEGSSFGSITKISKDSNGRIWCGNKRWDGISWFYPIGIKETIINPIDYTLVSAEGMAYLRTSSGQLWVWGKTPTPYYPTR